jgi:hypothetical protein
MAQGVNSAKENAKKSNDPFAFSFALSRLCGLNFYAFTNGIV